MSTLNTQIQNTHNGEVQRWCCRCSPINWRELTRRKKSCRTIQTEGQLKWEVLYWDQVVSIHKYKIHNFIWTQILNYTSAKIYEHYLGLVLVHSRGTRKRQTNEGWNNLTFESNCVFLGLKTFDHCSKWCNSKSLQCNIDAIGKVQSSIHTQLLNWWLQSRQENMLSWWRRWWSC